MIVYIIGLIAVLAVNWAYTEIRIRRECGEINHYLRIYAKTLRVLTGVERADSPKV